MWPLEPGAAAQERFLEGLGRAGAPREKRNELFSRARESRTENRTPPIALRSFDRVDPPSHDVFLVEGPIDPRQPI